MESAFLTSRRRHRDSRSLHATHHKFLKSHKFYREERNGMPLEFDPPHAGVAGTEFCRKVSELACDLAALLQRVRGSTGMGINAEEPHSPVLSFQGCTCYDYINTCEALAYELAEWCSSNPEGSYPFYNAAASSASAFLTATDEALSSPTQRVMARLPQEVAA